MLRNAKTIEGFELRAGDSRLGHVRDLYFDDERWGIRYLVVDTGGVLDGRRVLISPAAVHEPQWDQRSLSVDLTPEQVRKSPGIETEQPVSRDEELALTQYYNWPPYWMMAGQADGALGMTVPPPLLPNEAGVALARERVAHSAVAEHHLRSVHRIRGHGVAATDGAIGHVDDFIVDDATWHVAYLIVDTRNWLPGKKVLVAPDWIGAVGWEDEKVHVGVTREAIKASPVYDPANPMTSDYLRRLHDHYGRPRRDVP